MLRGGIGDFCDVCWEIERPPCGRSASRGHGLLSSASRGIHERNRLYDVLAFVAWARPPVPRSARAVMAKATLNQSYKSDRHLAFVEFVLDHYVTDGVDELVIDKLTPLLQGQIPR